MSKGQGVSNNTHTQQQRNDYANQHNPNNQAHQANNNDKNNYCEIGSFDCEYKYQTFQRYDNGARSKIIKDSISVRIMLNVN